MTDFEYKIIMIMRNLEDIKNYITTIDQDKLTSEEKDCLYDLSNDLRFSINDISATFKVDK